MDVSQQLIQGKMAEGILQGCIRRRLGGVSTGFPGFRGGGFSRRLRERRLRVRGAGRRHWDVGRQGRIFLRGGNGKLLKLGGSIGRGSGIGRSLRGAFIRRGLGRTGIGQKAQLSAAAAGYRGKTISRISSASAAPPAIYTYSMGTRRLWPASSVKTAPLKRWSVSSRES